jgi:hypothetical protein
LKTKSARDENRATANAVGGAVSSQALAWVEKRSALFSLLFFAGQPAPV